MTKTAFERCKELGGKIEIRVINPDTKEKRRVCFGVKDPKTKQVWGPVAEDKPYSNKKNANE